MSYCQPLYLFVFLPVVLLAYQLTSAKYRWCTLLLASYVFFWTISGKLVIYLIVTSLFTHYITVWMELIKKQCDEKKMAKKRRKKVLIFGIAVLLGILVYLKYYNFFAINIDKILTHVTSGFYLNVKTFLIPIGISFYTLEAIGYMADVYWNKVEAEKNPGKVALFLGFFPQIMEGPIALYSQTADELWEGRPLKGENLSQGCIRIFWGLFKKLIVADRLSMLVTNIFDNYASYHGMVIVIGAVAYTIQLYMEFSGCMDVIIGTGKLFGITMPENFRQPFLSKNASEFWRRWHITLGVWFKTYIFYPVSVSGIVKKWNKFARKNCSKYITKLGVSALCLFPVWLCNGLWHGSKWSYIFYGMYYFVILMLEIATEPLVDRVQQICHLNPDKAYYKILQVLKTWVIIFTGELFFRADGLKTGIHMFLSIFKGFRVDNLNQILMSVLDKGDYAAIIIGTVVVFAVGILKEKNIIGIEKLQSVCLPVRWIIYYGLIFAVIIFGAYGIGYQQVDLIYAGF